MGRRKLCAAAQAARLPAGAGPGESPPVLGDALSVFFAVFCALPVLGSGLIGLGLAWSARARSKALEARLARVERTLADLLARTGSATDPRVSGAAAPTADAPRPFGAPPPEQALPAPAEAPSIAEARSEVAASVAAPEAAAASSGAAGEASAGFTPEGLPLPAAAAPAEPAAPTPAPAATAAAPTAASVFESKPAFNWEQWLGERAFALGGAAILGLAALYLFKLAIENEWISPAMRVVLGVVSGVALIFASERWREGYDTLTRALAGLAVLVLYLSFWAAHARYQLLGAAGVYVAFVLMALTTSVGVLLAMRRGALSIAVMGLVGGLLTPILLSTGSDNPLGLFGYLLLLDAGFLYVSVRRRWAVLTVIAMVGSFVLSAGYVLGRMGADKLPIVLLALVAMSALFLAAAVLRRDDTAVRAWLPRPLEQGAAVLGPFCFALYFAATARFGDSFFPVAALLALQLAAAAWLVARAEPSSEFVLQGAAAAVVAVLLAAVLRPNTPAFEISLAVSLVALPAGLLAFGEWEAHRHGAIEELFTTTAGLTLGCLAVLGIAAAEGDPARHLAWALAGGALVLLAARARVQDVHEGFLYAAAALGALGVFGFAWSHHRAEAMPTAVRFLAPHAGTLVALHLAALITRLSHDARADMERAAAMLGVLLTASVAFAPSFYDDPFVEVLGMIAAIGALAALAASRAASGPWLLASVVAVGLGHSLHALARTGRDHVTGAAAEGPFVLSALVMLFFVLWPFLVAPRVRESRAAWASSALAPAAFFLGLERLFAEFSPGHSGFLAVGLGLVAFGSLAALRRFGPSGDAVRKSGFAWFGAVALGFAAVAIPLQLERQWITIGWALEGAAVIFLARRLEHQGLRYFGGALLTAVAVRLVLNPYVLEYGGRGTWPVVNWLLYTYWVPIAAMLAAHRFLAPVEGAAAPAAQGHARVTAKLQQLVGVYAVVLMFVWLNLAIADFFSTGRDIEISFERKPAKDLTTSIAWLLFAIGLLVAGMRRASKGLRWASLGLVLISVLKVFFWDLSMLEGLYRVFSLFGLGVSLIVIAVVYRRFVFRPAAGAASPRENPPATPAVHPPDSP